MDDWKGVIDRPEIRHEPARCESPPFPRYEVMMAGISAGIVAVVAVAILFFERTTL